MKTLVLKISLSVIGLSFITACAYMPDLSRVLPDKKSEYKKSESLPDLEIPPDLTANAMNDSMNIPDEAPATLSRYKNPRAPGRAPATTGTTETDEQWLSLPGSKEEFWPQLSEFFESRDFSLEVDDEELGVLETGWSQPVEQSGLINRYKYRIFSEPGDDPGVTVLFISQERQTSLDGGTDWVDQDKDRVIERQLVSELAAFAGGDQLAARPAATTVADKPAQDAGTTTRVETGRDLRVVDAGDGKLYLTIPEAIELAWKNTGIALRNSGLQIVGGDATKGLFLVSYAGGESRKKKGVLSRLAFWKGKKPKELTYQLSLTGVGNVTELIVLNEDGDWETTDDAARLLALIQGRYPTN